jgi:hypothetical protein
MKTVNPTRAELDELRADPILFEQELDCRPSVAEALEKALGFRAGRSYWRAKSGELYAIELGDFGRGRPSMALVYGFWPRFAPRPITDAAIDDDMAELCLWIADVVDEMQPEVMAGVLELAHAARDGGGSFRFPF